MTDDQYEEKEEKRGALLNAMDEYVDAAGRADMPLLDTAGEIQDVLTNAGMGNLTVEID